jgi:hypothetical protein
MVRASLIGAILVNLLSILRMIAETNSVVMLFTSVGHEARTTVYYMPRINV